VSEIKFELTGWKAILVLIAVVILTGFRFLSFQDKIGDEKLIQNLKQQILSDYLPQDVDRLKQAVESGDHTRISQAAATVTGTEINIESVQMSAPLVDFSTSKDVVVKVVYSLRNGSEVQNRKTLYLLYNHGAVENTWSYCCQTSALSYYLNFQ
jgi:hypothetical protein